ncbi:hypothetical protein EMMF5_001492 [Cystobasidiomycetes sp. EMM_F5]
MYCYENPDDNASSRDVAGEITAKGALSALHYDHGAVFRTVDFPPNHGDKSHRTQSIDFAMVISGEIYMELEPGQEILLKTGDTLVQRGTIHKWINRTDAYTRVLFVLLGAQPLKAEEVSSLTVMSGLSMTEGVQANKADYNLNE